MKFSSKGAPNHVLVRFFLESFELLRKNPKLNTLSGDNMNSKFFSAVAAMVLCFFVLGSTANARDCKKGKPCGNSCISKNDVCHKEETSSKMAAPTAQEPASAPAATPKSEAAAAAPVAAEQKSAAAPAKEKSCKKGKPCGSSCIPKDAVCHQ